MELILSAEQLEELGFRSIEDDVEHYWEYVLDEEDYFHSDYIYSEKVGIGRYRLIQYNNGENKVLNNIEFRQLIGDKDFITE